MVNVKKMNEDVFSKMENELRALGEFIRARQDEKQGLLDEFDLELKRYHEGKIAENTITSSVKKINSELSRLDKSIKDTIKKVISIANKMEEFVRLQSPISYKATESKIAGGKKKIKITKSEIAEEMKQEKKLMR